jgi:hypothetical protein
MIKMADASCPPAAPLEGISVYAGYIGGNTPHVWTRKEWDVFDGCKKLPIFVRSSPCGANQGITDAFAALRRLFELGVPKGTAVVLDLEAAVDVPYVNSFQSVISSWAGYLLWVYGSSSTLFQNPACDGYWVADPTNQPHSYEHPQVWATQYAENVSIDAAQVDLSVVRYWPYLESLQAW